MGFYFRALPTGILINLNATYLWFSFCFFLKSVVLNSSHGVLNRLVSVGQARALNIT